MLQADTTVTLGAGRYRLREHLAGSSYGIVWHAQREQDGVAVALKFVNAAKMAQAVPALQAHWVDSASKEIAFLRTLAPWDERHIVRLLDSGQHAGLPVMALELLDGSVAQHTGTVGVARALAWLAQINQALAKVHQYGWCYLDLKPANLLMHPDGGVRLTDFGTSRKATLNPFDTYTGTASWQAPEQFFPDAHGRYVCDARTDYFALGALLYYLVTGRQLRYCGACAEAFRLHGAQGGAWLRTRHQGAIPPTLGADEAARFADAAGGAATDLLRTLMAPLPAERPAGALAISRMLAAITPFDMRRAA